MTQLEEFVPRCDVDGVFFDFTLWPGICVCPVCRERYRKELGSGFPSTVDRTGPEWCTFQATRDRWVREFARDPTAKVRSLRPSATVEHKSAQALNNQPQWAPLPVARTPFVFRPPEGREVARASEAPDGPEVAFPVDSSGAVHAEVRDLEVFRMLAVELLL